MATGQSKIYLDIEARLRGNEDIKALNKSINETEEAAKGADSALVRAAKNLGVIPPTKAQNRIDALTKSFEELKNSGVLSAEQIDAAYERTLATINKISSAGAGDKFAASQGRETPSEIKARADLEADVARKTSEVKKRIREENIDAERRFAEELKRIQQSEAEYQTATDSFVQAKRTEIETQRVDSLRKSLAEQSAARKKSDDEYDAKIAAIQARRKAILEKQDAARTATEKARADRLVQIEEDAKNRIIGIRERLNAVLDKKPLLAQQVRNEALGLSPQPIRGATKALQDHDMQLAKTGVTARQTAAAMRMLPAQFSDIVVSLQGGQAPLTVFLQQGAQIKDSFGGAGNAVRAFGSYVLGLVNPFTVAAAAAASYAAILYTAQKEQEALTRSIIFSGNAIGLSTGQLANTAQAVATATNSTVGTVNELVAALAQSGKIGADNLALITEAAVRLEKVGGMSIKETTALMISLAKDPQKGLLELADKHGIVSLAIAEQVKRLIELGREEEAIALTQKFAADEFVKRAKIVEDSSGSLIKTFREVKKFAVDMWNSIFDLGRTDSDFQLKATEARIARLTELMKESDKQLLGGLAAKLYANQIAVEQKNLEVIKQKIAARDQETKAEGEATRAAKAAAEANEIVNKTIADGATKQQRLNKALAEYRISVAKVQAQRAKEGLAPLTDAQIRQGEQSLRRKILGETAVPVTTYRAESREGQKELVELQALANERKRLYDRNLIDLDTYYKGQRQLLDQQASTEQANYEAQRKRLGEEAQKFANDPVKARQVKDEIAKLDLDNFKFQSDTLAKINALEDERFKTVIAFRVELEKINSAYIVAVGENTSAEAIELRRLEIAQKYAAIEDKINTELSRRNVLNAEELEARKRQIQVLREQELAAANLAAQQKQDQRSLTDNSIQQVEIQSRLQQGLISQVEATVLLNQLKRQQLETEIQTLEQAVQVGNLSADKLAETQIRLAELRAQLAQTIPTVQLFADQFKVLFQDRIANSLTDVLTRTRSFKDAFKSLLSQIAADIIRSNISRLIAGAFGGSLAGGAGGTGGINGSALNATGGGTVFAADGGYITGPGTSTSDSIPARLSNGEFVVKASAVRSLGVDTLELINKGLLPVAKAFKNGGAVTTRKPATQNFANGGMVRPVSNDVSINLINNSSQPVRARQDQDPRTGVVSVILEDLQRGGPISRNINRVTGTGRAVAR